MIQPLANHLLQSTAFAALAGILTLALRNNHARTRYWIWLTASLKFLIPFSLFVEIGHRLSWSTAPVIAQPRLAFVVDEISQPFVVPDTVPVAIAPSIMPELLLAAWICGCAAVLIFWFVRWRSVAAILRASMPITGGRELMALRRFDTRIGLIASPSQMEPGVFGIVRPVLSLSAGIAHHLDDAQLDAIFAHELCHVRRRDNLTAALHMLVEAVFWFHPLVWWIGTRLVDERERACDEEVVRMGSDPEVYAESILKICKLYLESPLVCVSGVTGSDLKKRIETIMMNRVVVKLNFAKKAVLATAAAVALAIPVVIGIVNLPHVAAQMAPPPPPPPPPPFSATRATGPTCAVVSPAAATSEFEAASVKPAGAAIGGSMGGVSGGPGTDDPGRVTMARMPLSSLVMLAYDLKRDQLSGPLWIYDGMNDGYAITAAMSKTTTKEQYCGMLRNLLTDRFHLALHQETRGFPGYELTVAKGGSKLKRFTGSTNPGETSEPTPLDGRSGGFPKLPPSGLRGSLITMGPPGVMKMSYRGPLGPFATGIGPWVGWSTGNAGFGVSNPRVIDKTGLDGIYEIHLAFAGTLPGIAGADSGLSPAPVDTAPNILDAVTEQLGLKLQKVKAVSVDVLIIDHVDRTPTKN